MDRFVYGIQYDPTGEVMYSSSDEAKVRSVFDTISTSDVATGNFSLVCFERMDKYPIRPGQAVEQMGFMFGHE